MRRSATRPGQPRTPALVLGGGISALGALRVLARAGIPTFVTATSDRLLRRSRWFRAVPGPDGPPNPDDLPTWLGRVDLPGAVLVPCSDEWAHSASRLESPANFPASVASPGTLEILVDKARFAGALERLDIDHPASFYLDTAEDLDPVPDRVFENAFLKPRDSQSFHDAFGTKGLFVTSRSEARVRLEALAAGGHRMILQEYVPGPASNHYFVDGFVDAAGEVRALFVRRRLRMYPPSFGNSTYMKSVPPEDADGAVASLRRLLADLDYRGMFSAEFKLDPRSGRFRILEVNARAWWYVEFAARCGVDVCSMAYEDALGRPVTEVSEYGVGRTLVYPYSDYFALREATRRGSVSVFAGLRSWLGAAQPIFCLDDPRPGVLGALEVLRGRVWKGVSRLWSSTPR